MGRPNRLLSPRGRPNALNKATAAQTDTESEAAAPAAGDSNESEQNDNDSAQNDNEATGGAAESSTPQPTGLNRLKNRPKIQIQSTAAPKTKAPVVNVINRKVNPLISRRKLGGSSTTQGRKEKKTDQ